MQIKTNILLIVIIVVFFMLGGHLLDIGDIIRDAEEDFTFLVNRENLNNQYGVKYGAGNGFWTIDSRKLYHIGYYTIYLAFFIVVILYINLLFKKK